MATLEELVIQLTAETAGLRAEMNAAVKITESSMDKMQKSIDDFSKTSSKNTNFFTQAVASMTGFLASNAVTSAFNGLKSAVSALGMALKEGADDAAKEEVAMAKLANSMVLAGNYSQEAMSDLNDFASALEYQSGIADDVIVSNLSMLSSLTKLDKEGLKKAQQAAVDLAATINVDLDSATKMVAKGIEGNTDVFKRYGITIAETKDKTKQLEIVTSALINGMANAKINTFAGQIQLLGVNFGNLFESISKSFTSNSVVMATLKEINNIINKLNSTVNDSSGTFKTFVADAVMATVQGAKILVNILQFLNNTFEALQVVVGATVDTLMALESPIQSIKNLLSGEDLFENTKKNWQDFSDAVEGKDTLGVLEKSLTSLENAANSGFGALNSGMSTVTDSMNEVNSFLNKTPKFTEAQIAHNKAVQEWAKSLAETSQQLDSTYKFEDDLLRNSYEIQKATSDDKLAVEQQYLAAKLQLQQAYFEQERAQLEAARAQGLISETEYSNAVVALNQQQTLATVELKKQQIQNEKDIDKQRTENLKSTLGTISSLQSSSSKELQAVGKAAAIAQATMDGYAAVQKALASAPPPFNYALAAAVGAATAANVAKIAGVGLQRGIDEVPGIGNQDSFPAVLAPGERVVPAKTNEDLTEFLKNEQRSGPTINLTVNFNAPVWSKEQAGADIIEAANEAIARGLTTGLIKA